ncbi:MAG TPA: ATP-binding protein [Actinomycetota bacterium]|nr:ATP-binding protein [Actinomycetota bacterium]
MRRLRVQLTVLLALLGMLVVAWGATIFLGARDAARTSQSLQSTIDRFDQLRRRSGELGGSFVSIETGRRAYLLTGDPATYQAQVRAERQSAQLFGRVRELAAPWPTLDPVIDGVADRYRSWLLAGRRELAARQTGGAGAAGLVAADRLADRQFQALRTQQADLEGRLADLQTVTARGQGRTYTAAQSLAVRTAVMVLAAVALITFYLRRAVGAPADALRSASGRLAGGDLETPVELGVENELGAVASDLETMRRRLAGRMEALERLRHLSAQVVGATSLQRLAEVALDGLRPEVGATRAALGAVHRNGQLRLRALAGFPDPGVADDIVKADQELRRLLPMAALRAGQVVGMPDVDRLVKPEILRELAARMGIRSLALVPLVSRGSFVGLLGLCWTEPHRLDREQEALLGLAGNQIAGALAAALRLEEAERAAGEARAVFYAIADGVLLTDPFGRVTAVNRALEALTGWTEEEARGRPYAEVLPVNDQQGGAVDLLTRYGRKVPVAVSSAPILDPRSRVVGGVDVVRDVSREREIDEVKSALISTVSHELRTPLTLIHGFAELLVLRDMSVERQRTAAAEILEASRRLARLIDDLLSVSRMESGRLVLDPRPLDLAAVVERILSPFRAMADRHTLRAKLPGALPVLWGDPDKVEQILTNLVGNAIKYSPEGGEVLVTVEHGEDSVQVSVRDQGIGMSPRDMGQLFEKFYRVDRDEVRRAGGTGLGLYITKRLVEMHGGRIWAESRPGVGSVFTFTLPTSGELAGSGAR